MCVADFFFIYSFIWALLIILFDEVQLDLVYSSLKWEIDISMYIGVVKGYIHVVDESIYS